VNFFSCAVNFSLFLAAGEGVLDAAEARHENGDQPHEQLHDRVDHPAELLMGGFCFHGGKLQARVYFFKMASRLGAGRRSQTT
jgi:hypothetical protein